MLSRKRSQHTLLLRTASPSRRCYNYRNRLIAMSDNSRSLSFYDLFVLTLFTVKLIPHRGLPLTGRSVFLETTREVYTHSAGNILFNGFLCNTRFCSTEISLRYTKVMFKTHGKIPTGEKHKNSVLSSVDVFILGILFQASVHVRRFFSSRFFLFPVPIQRLLKTTVVPVPLTRFPNTLCDEK